MEILEVLGRWIFFLFDGLVVNFILKKIGKASDK